MPLYALNLFDLANNDLYLRYSRRSPEAVAMHGGRVIHCLGASRRSS